MAEESPFSKLNIPEKHEPEFFNSAQWENFLVKGGTTAYSGMLQALAEVEELLGLQPEGHAAFVTQELNENLEFLRELTPRSEELAGAGAVQMAGELLPAMAVPFGGTALRAALFGGLAASTIFNPESSLGLRGAQVATGVFGGGILGKLLNKTPPIPKGPHTKALERDLSRGTPAPEQLRLPAPSGPTGSVGRAAAARQRALPAPGNLAAIPARGPSVRSEMERAFTKRAEANLARREQELDKGFRAIEKARKQKNLSKATKEELDRVEARLAKSDLAARVVRRELERRAKAATLRGAAKSAFERSVPENTAMQDALLAAAQRAQAEAPPPAVPRPQGSATAEPPAAGPAPAGPAAPTSAVPRSQRGGGPAGPGRNQAGFFQQDALNFVAGGTLTGALAATQTDDPLAIGLAAGTGGLLARFLGKRLDKVEDHGAKKGMRQASKEGNEAIKQISRYQKAKNLSREALHDAWAGAKKVLDNFLGSVDTRLAILHFPIANGLRAMEYAVHSQSKRWVDQAEPFFKALDDAELTDAQDVTFKVLTLNNRDHGAAYLRKIGKTNAADKMDNAIAVLREAEDYLKSVGLGQNLRAGYFPRMVTDTSFFKNVKEIKSYIDHLVRQRGGKSLSDFEEEQVITSIINNALSSAADKSQFARAAGNLKKRTVKVNKDNVDAYADLRSGFNNYIDDITRQVERRKFFEGMGVQGVRQLGPNGENLDAVAAKLATLVRNKGLSDDQVDEIAELIRMRFGPGEQAPSRMTQNFKNLTYAGLLGNPIAAATQFGDVALSAYRNGLVNTAIAFAREVSGARRAAGTGIERESLLGLRTAAEEFASKVGSRDVLNWALNVGGFRMMDSLGKNTFINAALAKNQKMTKQAFMQKWGRVFDPDAPPGGALPRTEKLFEQVRTFRQIDETNRDDIGFMLWNELADVQPIGLSSLPKIYMQFPNGRMAYMLQTFTLRVFDLMRNDILRQMKTNPIQATKNFMMLSSYFTMMNSTADAAKAFVLGKDTPLPEIVLDSHMKMWGVNKYMAGVVSREGLGTAIGQTILPPLGVVDALTDPVDALGMLPPAGRFIKAGIQAGE